MADQDVYINVPAQILGFEEQLRLLEENWDDEYINVPVRRPEGFEERLLFLPDEWDDVEEIGVGHQRHPTIVPLPRLEVMSLKAVLALTKVEFNRRCELPVQNGLKSQAQMLWRMTISIIQRNERDGIDAIRLMGKLMYFESEIIHRTLFIIHDDESLVNSRLLAKLKSYGLIGDSSFMISEPSRAHHLTITMHSPLLVDVIRDQNEMIEMDLLRDCIKLLRRSSYCDPQYQTMYLKAVWDRALKYPRLVRDWKAVGTTLCKKLYQSSSKNLSTTISKTLETFQEILCVTDPAIIWLRCVELETLACSVKRNTEHSLYETVLIKCQKCRLMIDDYTRKNGGREDILLVFRRTAQELYRIAGHRTPFKKRLLEESLRFLQLLHARRRNIFEYKVCFPQIVTSLKELSRMDEILELLREIRRIIVKNKSKMYKRLDRQYYRYLFCILVSILNSKSKVLNFATNARKFRRLEKAILMELLIILEFGLEYLKHSKKKKEMWLFIRPFWPESVFYLVTCLIKLEKFDQLLATIQEADEMWTDCLAVSFGIDGSSHLPMKKFKEELEFQTRELTKKYLKIYSLIFEIVVTNIRLNCELKVKILNQLLVISKSLCSCSLQNDINYVCPWSEDAVLILIIQCFLELNQIDELVLYSKEYETLLESRYGYKEGPMVKAMLAFGDKQVKFLKPVVNRVEYFPLLAAIKLSARRYGKIILNDMPKNVSMRNAAMEIIKFCDQRLNSEIYVDVEGGSNWTWGTTWFEHEKREIESARKLFCR